MSSIFQSFQIKRSFIPTKQGLPVSQTDSKEQSLRRRLSSTISFKIQRSLAISFPSAPAAAASWAFRRSKLVSSMGEYAGNSVGKWWECGWGRILSKKPTFAKDLEMNEEESAVIGCHNKGSWGQVFYKVRSDQV